ncbi:MAG: TolC family protein, partial [Rhodothermales bacterium]
QRRTAETVLARLQDRDQVARIEPILEMTLPEAPKRPIDSLVATALDRRPVVGAIDASSRAADYRIQLAGKQLLPDFGLSITYFGIGNESIPASADGKNALAVAASVRVPLYRKSKRAGIESARVKRRQLDWDRQAIEADLRTRITELVSRIDQEAAQVRLFETILIPKAQSTLDATSNEYATGRMGFLDLLDAERMLFTLRTSLEDSTERYLVAVSELERTIGIGSLSEITD